MAIEFLPAEKIIALDRVSVSAQELYSRWVEWAADNLQYEPVFRQVGGDDLGSGLLIPPYFFLQDGWRVRPLEANHSLTISGNLFVEGGGTPVVSTIGNFRVIVQLTVPVQAQAFATGGSTGSGLTLSEIENSPVLAKQSTLQTVADRQSDQLTKTDFLALQ